MLTRQQLYKLYHEGPKATVQFIENLLAHIADQERIIGHQQRLTINDLSLRLARRKQELERVKSKLIKQECLVYELTRRLQQLQKALEELQPKPSESQAGVGNKARDSHNSNLPPSSDLPAAKVANAVRRNRSLRRQSGKKVGGQPGHPGRTLPRVERPDQVVVHSPDSCGNCAAPLSQSPVVNREKRQVFEIPPVKIEVIEHQAETRQCATHGNQKHKNGPFDRVHKAPGLSFFRSLIFEFEGDIFPCPPYMKPLIHA